jgi:SAM-dependent methyltransferase
LVLPRAEIDPVHFFIAGQVDTIHADIVTDVVGHVAGFRSDSHFSIPRDETGETESFEAVFSKDAIIHVADKAAVYREIARVLRLGGRIFISDWLTSDTCTNGPLLNRFLELAGHDFHLVSLADTGAIARAAGFTHMELVDRRDWYLIEATDERNRLRGDLGHAFQQLWGAEAYKDELTFWETLVEAVAEGIIRPSHIRASKP